MPQKRPREKFGTSQGHPGRLDRFMWKLQFKGQNIRGTDGTYDGTNETCPWDRRDTHTHQGVSCPNYLCLLFFLSPLTRGPTTKHLCFSYVRTLCSQKPILGRCPSTVRPVFPVLVSQLGKQQNRTRTSSSTVLGTPPNRTRTKKFPLEEHRGGCFVSWVLNSESTENWDFHRLEPYTKPYSDTS